MEQAQISHRYHSVKDSKNQQLAGEETPIRASSSKPRFFRGILARSPSSPSAVPHLKNTPLRKRALIQQIWNSSPLSPSAIRDRRARSQAQEKVNDGKQDLNVLATAQPARQGSGASPQRLRSLERAEIIWGPHADFELRERHTSANSRTPKPNVDPYDSDDSNGARLSAVPEFSCHQQDQRKPTRLLPSTPIPRTQSSVQRGPGYIFPPIAAEDPARKLTKRQLISQRVAFSLMIVCANVACLVAALESHRHLWVLILILFLKGKDILSTLGSIVWIAVTALIPARQKSVHVSPKWILTCVTAYAETEAQIMRTIGSVIQHSPAPHRMVLCIILDGKPQNIRAYFTRIARTMRRPYQTWRFKHGEVNVFSGFMDRVPVVMFEKIRNAGKKDSLILCHDLFDVIRDNASIYTKNLRHEIWTEVLPPLLLEDMPSRFDYMFFTDADSLIHEGTLTRLIVALSKDPRAIGACGLVLAEMQKGNEWSIWYLFQQFQVSIWPWLLILALTSNVLM